MRRLVLSGLLIIGACHTKAEPSRFNILEHLKKNMELYTRVVSWTQEGRQNHKDAVDIMQQLSIINADMLDRWGTVPWVRLRLWRQASASGGASVDLLYVPEADNSSIEELRRRAASRRSLELVDGRWWLLREW